MHACRFAPRRNERHRDRNRDQNDVVAVVPIFSRLDLVETVLTLRHVSDSSLLGRSQTAAPWRVGSSTVLSGPRRPSWRSLARWPSPFLAFPLVGRANSVFGMVPGSVRGSIRTWWMHSCWHSEAGSFLAGRSVSRPKIPKNQRRLGLEDSRRGPLHGVIALGGRILAQDGFEVHAVGTRAPRRRRARRPGSSAGWRFRGWRRSRGKSPPGWPSAGPPRPARVWSVILVSASPNRLGTILLSSILSSFSAALSKIGPVPRTIGGSSFCWRPKTTISDRRVRDTWTKGGPSESTT